MKILIAPNAFKHSLDATETADAIREGFEKSRLDCSCSCFPVGDGGDGTGELIINRCKGEWIKEEVLDPLGRPISASYGLIDGGKTAIIEMANASGIRLLKNEERNPLLANSYGTGQQIISALDKGARRIIVGMGGSATVDGASGMLRALGIRFLDKNGNELKDIPGSLGRLAEVDDANLDPRTSRSEIIVLCDVNNYLLGDLGAAAMFGPQKGASPKDVKTLDAALSQMATVARDKTGKDMASIPYGGTAGGASAGLYAFAGAKLVNGIDYFLELTGFGQALEQADLVITGEGSIDEQTLQGKGPFGVAHGARQKGLPVIGLAGKVPSETLPALGEYFDTLLAIGNGPMKLDEAIQLTRENLVRTAEQLGNLLAARK